MPKVGLNGSVFKKHDSHWIFDAISRNATATHYLIRTPGKKGFASERKNVGVNHFNIRPGH